MSVQVRPLAHSAWTPFTEHAELTARPLAAGQVPLAGHAWPVLQQTDPELQLTLP